MERDHLRYSCSTESVSYTHLDVYKRQVLALLICLNHFMGRFVKVKIYVACSAAMIILLVFLLYINLFHFVFKFLIVISIVFVAEFVFGMVERKMNL